MTKREFENLYSEKLKLSEKNWFLMPERSVLSNNKVIISGHKEIDFDYLYFVVKDEVWEMYLESNVKFVEQDFLLPCDLFGRCILQKKDFSYGVDKVQFKNSGIKGQVIVILDHFATKVVSILDEKSFKEEMFERELKQASKITEKSDATKWAEIMISEKVVTLEDLTSELGIRLIHGSIQNYVLTNVDLSKAWINNAWDWTYLDTLVENAKFVDTLHNDSNSNTIVPEEMFEKFKENYKLEEIEEGPVLAGKFKDKPTKISEGKLFYELDWEFVEGMAKRMELNKQNGKYSVFGWRDKGVDVPEMNQALIRHLIAILKGEVDDSGQEYGHYLALACNSMLIINQLKKDKDGTTTV